MLGNSNGHFAPSAGSIRVEVAKNNCATAKSKDGILNLKFIWHTIISANLKTWSAIFPEEWRLDTPFERKRQTMF